MSGLRLVPIAVVLLGVTLAACSAGASTPAKSVSIYDSSESTWFAEPFDPSDVPDPDPAQDDTPADPSVTGPSADGVEIGSASTPADAAATGDQVADGVTTDPIFHPCSYVSTSDWAHFALGSSGTDATADAYELEPGEKCLYVVDGDRTRMTVTVSSRAGSTGWLDASAAGAGETVADLPGGVWLPGYPTSYANTMVSSYGDVDAVIVVYTLDKKLTPEVQKSAALRWLSGVLNLISMGQS